MGHILATTIEKNKQALYWILSVVPLDPTWEWWDDTLDAAIGTQDLDFIERVKSLQPPNYVWDKDEIIIALASTGNIGLFDYFRSKWSLTGNFDWTIILPAATVNQTMFYHVLKFIPKSFKIDWNFIALNAIHNDNLELFDELENLAPVNYKWNWNDLALEAIDISNMYLFDYILSAATKNYGWDWEGLAIRYILSRDIRFAELIFEISPLDFDWDLLMCFGP